MRCALKAEALRLLSLRSTLIFAVLLVGSCFGPIIVMTLQYDIEYGGPIEAGDLGKCVSIFHVLAIVFAGAYTATEIKTGATAVSFLTQRTRGTALAAQLIVESVFIIATYIVGMTLALGASLLYPDGLTMTTRGWAYLGVYLIIVLAWAAMTTSLAVITRSVATAIAVPLVWMLLLEQLMSIVPMFAQLVQWMPFSAGMSVLAHTLGESSSPMAIAQTIIALVVPAVLPVGIGYFSHMYRDVPE